MFGRNKDKDYYDIGRKGTVEEFCAANKRAVEHVTKEKTHLGADDQKKLRKGAIDALVIDGRPENLLEAIKFPEAFAIRKDTVNRPYCDSTRANIFAEVADQSTRPSADLALLLSVFSQNDRQEQVQKVISYALGQLSGDCKKELIRDFFTHARWTAEDGDPSPENMLQTLRALFYYTVSVPGERDKLKERVGHVGLMEGVDIDLMLAAMNDTLYGLAYCKGTVAAVEAILSVGADAQGVKNNDGYKGRVLATAVKHNAPADVIALLHQHGADFADALYLMRTKPDEKWEEPVIQSLKAHAKHITGKPLEEEVTAADALRQIQELRDELTKATGTIDEMSGALQKTQSRLDEVSDELRQARKELGRMTGELEQVSGDFNDASERLAAAESGLAKANTTISALTIASTVLLNRMK